MDSPYSFNTDSSSTINVQLANDATAAEKNDDTFISRPPHHPSEPRQTLTVRSQPSNQPSESARLSQRGFVQPHHSHLPRRPRGVRARAITVKKSRFQSPDSGSDMASSGSTRGKSVERKGQPIEKLEGSESRKPKIEESLAPAPLEPPALNARRPEEPSRTLDSNAGQLLVHLSISPVVHSPQTQGPRLLLNLPLTQNDDTQTNQAEAAPTDCQRSDEQKGPAVEDVRRKSFTLSRFLGDEPGPDEGPSVNFAPSTSMEALPPLSSENVLGLNLAQGVDGNHHNPQPKTSGNPNNQGLITAQWAQTPAPLPLPPYGQLEDGEVVPPEATPALATAGTNATAVGSTTVTATPNANPARQAQPQQPHHGNLPRRHHRRNISSSRFRDLPSSHAIGEALPPPPVAPMLGKVHSRGASVDTNLRLGLPGRSRWVRAITPLERIESRAVSLERGDYFGPSLLPLVPPTAQWDLLTEKLNQPRRHRTGKGKGGYLGMDVNACARLELSSRAGRRRSGQTKERQLVEDMKLQEVGVGSGVWVGVGSQAVFQAGDLSRSPPTKPPQSQRKAGSSQKARGDDWNPQLVREEIQRVVCQSMPVSTPSRTWKRRIGCVLNLVGYPSLEELIRDDSSTSEDEEDDRWYNPTIRARKPLKAQDKEEETRGRKGAPVSGSRVPARSLDRSDGEGDESNWGGSKQEDEELPQVHTLDLSDLDWKSSEVERGVTRLTVEQMKEGVSFMKRVKNGEMGKGESVVLILAENDEGMVDAFSMALCFLVVSQIGAEEGVKVTVVSEGAAQTPTLRQQEQAAGCLANAQRIAPSSTPTHSPPSAEQSSAPTSNTRDKKVDCEMQAEGVSSVSAERAPLDIVIPAVISKEESHREAPPLPETTPEDQLTGNFIPTPQVIDQARTVQIEASGVDGHGDKTSAPADLVEGVDHGSPFLSADVPAATAPFNTQASPDEVERLSEEYTPVHHLVWRLLDEYSYPSDVRVPLRSSNGGIADDGEVDVEGSDDGQSRGGQKPGQAGIPGIKLDLHQSPTPSVASYTSNRGDSHKATTPFVSPEKDVSGRRGSSPALADSGELNLGAPPRRPPRFGSFEVGGCKGVVLSLREEWRGLVAYEGASKIWKAVLAVQETD